MASAREVVPFGEQSSLIAYAIQPRPSASSNDDNGHTFVKTIGSCVKFVRNALATFKNRIVQMEVRPAQPKILSVFTTNRCNFSCFYCSRNVDDESSGATNKYQSNSEFHLDDLRLLLEAYPSIQEVSFVGVGEPFLIADLLPLARMAKEYGKSVRTISNGTLLHNHWGSIAPTFDEISISLHGLTAAELNAVAKVGQRVFDQFLANISHLVTEEQSLNPHMRIRASVVGLKHDIGRVARAAEFCKAHGIPVLDIHNYLPVSLEDTDNCIYDDELQLLEGLGRLCQSYSKWVRINPPVPIRRNVSKLAWACPEFFNTLRVDGLGQVCGCTKIMVPRRENGDWRSESDVWNNNYFVSMRKRFRARSDLPSCCRFCPRAQ